MTVYEILVKNRREVVNDQKLSKMSLELSFLFEEKAIGKVANMPISKCQDF